MSLGRDPNSAFGQSNLCFRDLAFDIKSSEGEVKCILTPTSGAWSPGNMVALMVRRKEIGSNGGFVLKVSMDRNGVVRGFKPCAR